MNAREILVDWTAGDHRHHLAALARTPPDLQQLFADDAERPQRMSLSAAGIHFDYARQRLSRPILALLLALARDSQLAERRESMFAGQAINETEMRPVLHVALRGSGRANPPWGEAIDQAVGSELARFCDFADAVRGGRVEGWSGEPICEVVNLGIGGSDLGPRMACEALAHLADGPVRLHFVSNPDAWALHEALRRLDPRRTLFIVSSKTFTTQETLTNAASARRWLADAGCPEAELDRHFVAVTANSAQAQAAGYAAQRIFRFWDWVGGRYSVWSAIGLPLALAIGSEEFRTFLAGAQAMDEHFRSAPLDGNIPVVAALVGLWNRNFLHMPSHLIVAYASRLRQFTSFIQQMDMESNGKRVHLDGSPCAEETAPIVWGGLGIDGQHAYFQLLHQGRHAMPVDFIGVLSEDTPLPLAAEHHRVANANLLAQARALAFGRDYRATLEELGAGGMEAAQAELLARHRTFPGNVPSNLIWLEKLDARTLGALIALYEHKVFTQAALWRINAFDQWGVELGKKLVHEIHPALGGGPLPAGLDAATRHSLDLLLGSVARAA